MKLIFSTDWHFGEKSNSDQHNEDLLDFIDFMGEFAVKNKIKTFVHGGDMFHSRDKLSVNTINYAIRGIDKLNGYFDQYFQIKGNHDLFLKDSRDISSLEIFRDKAILVDDWEIIQDKIMLVSWITNGEEYDNIINLSKKHKIKYMFGHFEFSGFKLNDNYIMEHGQSHKELKHIDKVFSGHYHHHQVMDNVDYVGTPFPYNYNDANDFDRGFIVFDSETGETERINYSKVNVISVTHEELLSTDWENVPDNLSVRVVIDEELDDESLEKIKNILEGKAFRDTKVVYKIEKDDSLLEAETDLGDIENIDDMVIHHLQNMNDVEGIDKNLLVELYKGVQDD